MDSPAVVNVNVSRLHFPVTTLGPGRRVGIWFQGCSIRCKGCLAVDTWDPHESVSVEDVIDSVSQLVDDAEGVDGITISGGEPFDQPAALQMLLAGLRGMTSLDQADVLVYSGYTLSVIKRLHGEILHLVDALISGPFVASRPTKLPWRGSANQVLTCLTERAEERFDAPASDPRIQVSVEGGRVWMIGIPRHGDLDRLKSASAQRGVKLEEVSWMS